MEIYKLSELDDIEIGDKLLYIGSVLKDEWVKDGKTDGFWNNYVSIIEDKEHLYIIEDEEGFIGFCLTEEDNCTPFILWILPSRRSKGHGEHSVKYFEYKYKDRGYSEINIKVMESSKDFWRKMSYMLIDTKQGTLVNKKFC